MRVQAIVHVYDVGQCYSDVNLLSDKLFAGPYHVDQRTQVNLPPLNCSKYLVVGEPKLKKSKSKREKLWKRFEITTDTVDSDCKEPSFDQFNLYGELKRYSLQNNELDERCIFPPIDVLSRRHLFDADVVKERQLIGRDYVEEGSRNRFRRREVYVPSVYHNYFSNAANRNYYTSTKYAQEFIVRNRRRTSCKKCKHQQTSSVHFCDVLGKRVCEFCTQYVNRHFSQIYEQANLHKDI